MLKPLNRSKQVEKKKPAQIIVSLVNGKQVYSNSETGEIVNMDHNRYTPSYEVFNNEKASIVISSLAQGHSLIDALEYASVSKATFATWLMTNDTFTQAVDKARSTRAHFTHEEFHQVSKSLLTSDIPTEKDEIQVHLAQLSILERRQKILSLQKKEDNPHRFSDKDMNQSMAASVAISIDPDIISKMQTRFKSKLDVDGELDVSSSSKALDDILNADYKEVTDE